MSSVRARTDAIARRAGNTPPVSTGGDARCDGDGRRQLQPVQGESGGEARTRGHQQPLPGKRRPDDVRLLVFEPRAHPRVGDGVGDGGRGQPRGVVRDQQPAAEDVGRHRLEPGKVLEAPLEDRDLLVTIHPVDLEDRFGVHLAHTARRRRGCAHRPAPDSPSRRDAGIASSTCSSPCAKSRVICASSRA